MDDPERKKILEAVLTMLDSDDFKDNFISELNEAVDIPILNEKKEGRLFRSLYKVLTKVIKDSI
tara:strand:- start:708 stop:899 length:192 start_codon:yes stop_codon:yes gene_type:complete